MGTNRNLINDSDIDSDIITSRRPLDRGWFIAGTFEVPHGHVAVITESGVFRETLPPGKHSLGKYQWGREIVATVIKTTDFQPLFVSTSREFRIHDPFPTDIDLDLSVEYKVVDPKRVVEVGSPLTILFARIISVTRDVIANASRNAINFQSQQLARAIHLGLRALLLEKQIGIEVQVVSMDSIRILDAGSDVVARTGEDAFVKIKEWETDSFITQQSQITWPWLLMNQPEIAGKLIDQWGTLAVGHFDIYRDPTGGPVPEEFQKMMDSIFPPGLFQGTTSRPSGAKPPELTDSKPDIHARMQEERDYLVGVPGVDVEIDPGMDGNIPNGSYMLKVKLPRTSGGQIVVFFGCNPDYPTSPPLMTVEVDGQEELFQSAIIRQWRRNYLVEIVREIKNWYG